MISGDSPKVHRRQRPREAALVAIGVCLWAGGTHGADIAIDELMAMLAQVRESSATFTEERTGPAFTMPLTSRGTLHFVAPARIEKRTTEPKEERLIVDGDRITLERPSENARRSLGVDEAPEIRTLVEAIRGTLTGNIESLRRYYSVGLEGEREKWRLTLVPNSPRVRQFLRAIRIEGTGSDIRIIETLETSGDVSRMTTETSKRP
jgi:outer membrane lipoprotein-sorting protein